MIDKDWEKGKRIKPMKGKKSGEGKDGETKVGANKNARK
jgi:hypothetical protein